MSILRNTAQGRVEGRDDSANTGTWSWKGLPFAQPPIGELRWRAPVEPAPWSDVRPARDFGHPCLQNGRIYGPGANNRCDETIASTLNQPIGSEDCLTLNIWRPATDVRDLPVLVFIHGGSNISGYSADPIYDGAHLARRADAVVVTLNYRLGVLGFLDLPQLHAGGDAETQAEGAGSGNFALLDILAALRWVRRNIGEFGGDPQKVTAMGQSAGAINLLALLVSPLSSGLFQQAIALSGGISLAANLPPGSIPTLNSAEAYKAQGRTLLLNLLVADGSAADLAAAESHADRLGDAGVAAYLRGQDARHILRIVLAKGLSASGPIPDGKDLPLDPIASIAAGRCQRMPILTGITRDEGKLFAAFLPLFGGPPGIRIDDATRFSWMQDFDPDAPARLTAADLIDPAYLPVGNPATGYDARTALLTDRFMRASADNLLQALGAQQREIWHYRFDWSAQSPPWNEVYGAAHLFDLPFLFGNFGPSLVSRVIGGEANRGGRLALAEAMMGAVAAFLRHGDPGHAALGSPWERWPARLVFDADAGSARISSIPG